MQAKLCVANMLYIPMPEGKLALGRFSAIMRGPENQETSPARGFRGSPRICFA
jgi:hypothetical protein